MTAAQPDPKCPSCQRTTETHAPGCSHVDCPNRHPQMWAGPEGSHGFPGTLAEDRIVARVIAEEQACPS